MELLIEALIAEGVLLLAVIATAIAIIFFTERKIQMESKINKKIEELMEYNKKHNTQLSYGQFVALEQKEMQQKQKSGVEAAKTYLSRYKSLAEDDRRSKYGYQIMNDINKKIELVYNVDLIDVLYYLYVKCFDVAKTAEIIGVSVSTIRNWHAEALEIFAKEVLKK